MRCLVCCLVILFPNTLPHESIVLVDCLAYGILLGNVDFTLLRTDHICARCVDLIRSLVVVCVTCLHVPVYQAPPRLALEDGI